MTSRIQVLPESVARRIAAGEVIERPASVVKELVENAIDAGARSIVVEIDQGGRDRIAVTDDGSGMSREEVPVAFRPHATSKIRDEEDLLRVSTLGFRGEALPSIAAVAAVEVHTRRDREASGTRFRIRGGEPEPPGDAGVATGTRIEVRDLFFNTPVRRKFLKSPSTEGAHVAQLVPRLALSVPEVAFRLVQNGRETLDLPRADFRARVRAVLGRDVDRVLHPVAADGPVRLEGLATHPHYAASNARSLHWFVNGRWVRDRMLQHALLSAYATLLPHGRFPAAALRLTVPPEEVDVNVHPTKTEIRFRSSQGVYDVIHRAVRNAFGARPAPPTVAERPPEWGAPAREDASGFRRDDGDLALVAAPRVPGRLRLVPAAPAEPPQAPLFPDAGTMSSLRIVGQLFDGYLVCEGPDTFVLIDQHAAHERVAFERLREQRLRGRVASQPLLVPQTVELSPGEVELFAEAAPALEALGFEVEPFGERAVVVRALPATFPPRDASDLVRSIAGDLEEHGRTRAIEERIEDLLSTIACHSVVRVGQNLSEAEIRSLLAAMDSVDLNTNCPHGRPVTATVSRAELERWFGR